MIYYNKIAHVLQGGLGMQLDMMPLNVIWMKDCFSVGDERSFSWSTLRAFENGDHRSSAFAFSLNFVCCFWFGQMHPARAPVPVWDRPSCLHSATRAGQCLSGGQDIASAQRSLNLKSVTWSTVRRGKKQRDISTSWPDTWVAQIKREQDDFLPASLGVGMDQGLACRLEDVRTQGHHRGGWVTFLEVSRLHVSGNTEPHFGQKCHSHSFKKSDDVKNTLWKSRWPWASGNSLQGSSVSGRRSRSSSRQQSSFLRDMGKPPHSEKEDTDKSDQRYAL